MDEGGGGYEESYGNDAADFVDFSGDLKKLLKNAADTEIDHWLSQDLVEALNEAIKAFVSEMCSGSLTVLENGKKKGKVLNPSHIVEALELKGFNEIAKELKDKHGSMLQVATKRTKKKGGDEMSEEQMLELQQQLFAQAKARQALDQ